MLRSPKVLLGGIAHLGWFIDKVRLRHAGKIPDYNCIMVGVDTYLIDFLQIGARRACLSWWFPCSHCLPSHAIKPDTLSACFS
ncbi:MAG: DUF5069 domain-containing protein [Nitrospira sp.]|nr:DUF5069 domain-containing protein [Nitrospira sp.]MBP6604709.1 DUF5069 domain-containing protein [Nitrospira sp.]